MFRWTGARSLVVSAVASAIIFAGCIQRPVAEESAEIFQYQLVAPLSRERKVDILFVVDNSGSMLEEQANLRKNFPRLIEALRSPAFGDADPNDDRPCTDHDASGCAIPDLRLGVTSTDLGSLGKDVDQTCLGPGDGGRLLIKPRIPGCALPSSDRFISFSDGRSNVAGAGSGEAAIEAVKQAFSCIAAVGTEGCGFEQPLEAARRALSPEINGDFLRPDALLAIVFITDEDDCSARSPQLFDARNTAIGPLTNFRCFPQAVTCEDNNWQTPGQRRQCSVRRDQASLLHNVDDYIRFFQDLRPKGRVLIASISGPSVPIIIGQTFDSKVGQAVAEIAPSCHSPSFGEADPAPRLSAVVEAFGDNGQQTSICDGDLTSALDALGRRIRVKIGGQCLERPVLTTAGGVACASGDRFGDAACDQGCLQQSDCVVSEKRSERSGEVSQVLPKCAEALWSAGADATCEGADCPCWRIMRRPATVCSAQDGATPYGLDVLRRPKQTAPAGAVATLRCRAVKQLDWQSAELSQRYGSCSASETAGD
ncbi:MAG: hypothetical protein H6707_18265 [Deltaproteobacteria bacterium]|nr:hypothetical protein [Deltaproteobacteria bacterium]